ncbi:mpv17-like protein 2 [Daphnia pulex]|uniref:mpv17-like protein 2 n=1 Tax=Daphnia pulex TaxID=6669 RepID=UPI001EE081E0|nr:mpv17-like protein 2 [Daphnia pulex]
MLVKSFALSLARLKWKTIVQTSKVAGKTLFGRYLLVTNVTISTTLSGVGDALQQQYEIVTGDKPNLTWDKNRTLDMSATGTVVGVICHFWYNWLDQRLPGKAFKIIAKKLLVDQIFFSPFLIAVFFGTVGVLEHMSTEEVLEEIKSKAWRLYAAEWIVWPPAQLINFYLLPTRFRVLYDNTISLGYDVYTSYVKHDKG